MRDRPFIAAGEQPRPFSEVVAERNATSIEHRRLASLREQIAHLEGEAIEAAEPTEKKRLQCAAEAIRIELDEELAIRRLRT